MRQAPRPAASGPMGDRYDAAQAQRPQGSGGGMPHNTRGGFAQWWLSLTAPPGALQYEAAATSAERERLRRAGLTSFVAPFMAIAPVLLLGQASVDTITLVGILAFVAIIIGVLILNRLGQQTAAALLLVVGMDLVIEGALLGAGRQGGLGSGWLLTYDLFVVALITVGLLLSRRFLWLFATIHIGFILGDFYLLPHTEDLTQLIVLWHGDSIAYARPLLIQIVGALLSFVQVGSTDRAIARADRAEDLAALEHAIVEQQRQIEFGAQQLREAHVRVANGDFSARSNVERGNLLWDVSQSLNNLLQRFQRTAQTEFQLRRTEEELRRLASAIDEAQNGRRPIWPAMSGTAADLLIERIAGRQRQGQGQTGTLMQPNTGMLGTQSMPGTPGGQPYPSLQPPAAPPPYPPSAYPPGTFASPRVPTISNPIRGSAFDAPLMPASSSLPPLQPPPATGSYGQGAYDPYGQPADPNDEPQNRQQGDNPWFLPPENSNW